MKLNPDTLQPASGNELAERQRRTEEMGDGRIVVCHPDLTDYTVTRQASRAVCLAMPYAACPYCRHSRFEYVFTIPTADSWVQCPRWLKAFSNGPPNHYVPVGLSECRAKPHPFCHQCPSQEELAELLTDKQKEGWLERYSKLTKEGP